MPANFSIWAITEDQKIISKLVDLTFDINSILNIKFQDGKVSGQDYFLETNLASAYSYYPDCITSEKLKDNFSSLSKEGVFAFNEIVKSELQKGI